jgi:SAM-dependent methyltransferase
VRGTTSDIIALPCSGDLVDGFLDRVDLSGAVALMLEKQAPSLTGRLRARGVERCYLLPEALYGRVTRPQTVQLLQELNALGAKDAWFPFSDFCGNTAPLLRLVAPRVTAISATAPAPVRLQATGGAADDCLPSALAPGSLDALQARIVTVLAGAGDVLREMAQGSRSGEKPTTGLLDGFPYDAETLFRYAVAASGGLTGRALEIGCGLGFGAYLVAASNPDLELTAVDTDDAAIAAARRLWGTQGNLHFACCDGDRLDYPDQAFESVIGFEVIEHVDDPAGFLQQARRVLKPGGTLLGSTPESRLFAFQVNHTGQADPLLRRQGIWPWHVQEFDEQRIDRLLQHEGFTAPDFSYPTYETGLRVFDRVATLAFPAAVEELQGMTWRASDFSLRRTRVPCFSGSSFVFRARRSA